MFSFSPALCTINPLNCIANHIYRGNKSRISCGLLSHRNHRWSVMCRTGGPHHVLLTLCVGRSSVVSGLYYLLSYLHGACGSWSGPQPRCLIACCHCRCPRLGVAGRVGSPAGCHLHFPHRWTHPCFSQGRHALHVRSREMSSGRLPVVTRLRRSSMRRKVYMAGPGSEREVGTQGSRGHKDGLCDVAIESNFSLTGSQLASLVYFTSQN